MTEHEKNLPSTPSPSQHLEGPHIEIDDGVLIYRSGTLSVTVCAEKVGVYDTATGKPAVNVPLNYDAVSAVLDVPRPTPPREHLRVKPLEWRALAVTDREAAVADSILGKWEVWHFPNGSTYIMKPGEHQGTVYEGSYDEAKAYMERVYQRRIAPALTTEGQPDA